MAWLSVGRAGEELTLPVQRGVQDLSAVLAASAEGQIEIGGVTGMATDQAGHDPSQVDD